MNKATRDNGVRFLAALLTVGGLVGIGISLFLGYAVVRQHWILVAIVGAFSLVFVWTFITGVRLWRGDERGVKWAKILFAAQIPVLTIPGLGYEYYAGISIKLLGGSVSENVVIGLGARGNFYLDTTITDLKYGVNIFAAFALVYLLHRLRPGTALQSQAVG